MDDRSILSHISELVAEEKTLRLQHAGEGLDDADRERLHRIELDLDQCWDLLRQRRAKEEIGDNPDNVETRPASEIESYLQ
jgi:Protein of unknown function (DUF2630)